MSPKRRRVGRGRGGDGGGEGRGGGGRDGGDGGRGGGYGGGGGRGAESSPARVLKRRCRSFDLEIRGCACCRHHQELHESSVQSLQNSFGQFKQEMREMITSLVNRLPDPRERVEQSCCQPPCYKLIFENSMNDEIFTTREVQAADGDHIKVRMVSSSQQDSNFLPRLLSTATVKIVVLDGDFNADNHDVWASEDFEDHVVRPRDKHGVVLTGKLVVKLENGEGCLHNVTFVDNSKFTRSGKFRLGVKIIGDVGEQVQEGISEPFTVKHRRGEAHKKSVIPSTDDELWRLNGIGKNGISQKLLEQNGIFSVKDFLRRYHKDENALRNILNAPSAWTTIVGHAKKCDPGSALYSHFVEDKNIRLYFSSLGHIVGASVAGQYTDFGDLDPFLKVQVEESSKDAYDCVTYHQPDYEMYSSQPRPINRSTLQGSILPGPKSTESTDQVMHEADEQGTSNGPGFSGSDCQNSAFERPGSVQVRTIPTVPENDETDATIDIQLESRPEIQYETLNPNCHTGSGSMHSTTAAEEITESVAQNQGALLMHQENYQMDYTNDGLSLGHWYSEEQVASQYAYPFSPSMEADLPVYSAPGSFSMDEMFDYITMDDNPHFFAPIASEQPANVHCGITKLPSCRRWVKLNVLLRWKAKLRASKRAKASVVEQEG